MPMLERLRIQNFKSWQDTGDMAFGSLTGFFGTNSSGKSSILQFLLMLKQTVESSDRSRVLHLGDDKSYVDLGTMYDILHNHEDPGLLMFDFDWKARTNFFDWLEDNNKFWDDNKFSFGAEILRTDDYVELMSFAYTYNRKTTGIKIAGQPSSEFFFENHNVFHIIKNKEIIGQHTSPLKFYNAPHFIDITLDEFNKDYATDSLPRELENLFERIEYLGPLREYPNRLYIWAGEQTQSVGSRGERAIAALLSSRNKGHTIDMGEGQPKRTVEEHVAHWLKELGLIYSFKVQPIAPNRKEYEVRIQRTAESASVFLTDVGFGVSQILPVLVLLFYVPEGSTVILEQPEIHLHPAVQAGLADVFIDAIKRRKLQIILESHSEHLLQRLQRRMAEEIIEPDAVKLYFTSIEEGKSKLTPL
ncbi:AAA family ATPase [Hymenobacter baengnokdamensis]|uniref:AAA family ATPase n=1 Tax=Hymenobacter baengnokdamensis TaxID=2615203 RepID=UPI001E405E26|nr:AAA family ATPase [Hymenobacter baengnokdamensis]